MGKYRIDVDFMKNPFLITFFAIPQPARRLIERLPMANEAE